MTNDDDHGRVAALMRLHMQWAAELEHIKDVDAVRAKHQAEAIEDLVTLIREIADRASSSGGERIECGVSPPIRATPPPK